MDEEKIQAATAITTAEYDKLRKKADILEFLFGEKGVRMENLMKLQIWREKADRWDQYAIYDNDKEEEILVKDLIIAYEKLGRIREFLRNAPLPPGEALDEVLSIIDGEAES